MQKAITKQGNYRFPVPIGATYTLSATGTFNGSTLTLQYLNDVIAAGTAQVETATVVAAAGATSAGILTVVFNSAKTPSLSIPVALTLADHTTAALIATAIKDALNANAQFAASWTATTSTADVVITAKADEYGHKRANDPECNLAIPAGLGVTAAATSTNTTAGVASKTVTGQPYSTSALSLTAAGEKTGINCGSHPEINVAITVADPTGIVVNVNPAFTLVRQIV